MQKMYSRNVSKTPPILSMKQACFLMIPLWMLWAYLLYLLFSYSRVQPNFKIEPLGNVSGTWNNSSVLYSVDIAEALQCKARIGRIYSYLNGDTGKNIARYGNSEVRVLYKRLPSIFFRRRRKKKKACRMVPDALKGRLRVDLSPHGGNASLVTVPSSPLSCIPRHRVALIIPYRDREEHLVTLLNTLHPLLRRQQIDYRVYVVEQFGNDTFNKGVLMNAGVRESLKDRDFGCFVFHDVDLIPEDDRNMYTCPSMPRHMSVAVDKFNYTLPYPLLVGGVFSIRLDHFLTVNGYSNLYWGWGGEDDDMAYRIKYRKLEIIRPPETIARYSMIKHDHRPESPNAIRTALLRMAKKRSARDGLNTAKYRVVWRHDTPSHTHLMIDIGRNHRWHFMDSQQRLIINF